MRLAVNLNAIGVLMFRLQPVGEVHWGWVGPRPPHPHPHSTLLIFFPCFSKYEFVTQRGLSPLARGFAPTLEV